IVFRFACVAAMAQPAGPDAPSSAPTGAPAPSEPQGFFDAFGNWVQQGVANVGAGVGAMVGAVGGQAGQAAKGAADAARDAATSVTKLPGSSVIGGPDRCTPPPNTPSDCPTATAASCRTKANIGGSSVDFETVEKCPPPYRTSGRNTPEGICTMEHFVTRALCQ